MASLTIARRTIAALFTISILLASQVNGQNCYYPNGDVEGGMGQCASDVGACCPFNWECLTNGLCYLPSANYFGRYACSDQTWQSDDCPQICTQGNTATGNEAVLQCSDGSYCCDGDRSFNCCTTADTKFFNLPSGRSYASITWTQDTTSAPKVTNAPPSTSLDVPVSQSAGATSSSDIATTSVTTAPSGSSAAQTSSSTTASDPDNTTSIRTSSAPGSTVTIHTVTSGADGVASTVTIISTAAPVSAATSSGQGHGQASGPSSSSHLGVIIGCAAGIPVVILACAILACLLWRRRKAKRNSYTSPSPSQKPSMVDMYGHRAPDGRAPEIDGHPVARGNSHRKSELAGSTHFGHSPALSTASTAPPQYSPAANMQPVQEEPAELWGGYMPYRQPRSELPAGEQTRPAT